MGTEVERRKNGTFEKGVSGNPSGRPKEVLEVIELARQHHPIALATLVDIAENGKNEMARFKAAEYLWDRGYGKAGSEVDRARGDGTEVDHFTFNPAGPPTIEGVVVREEDEPLD